VRHDSVLLLDWLEQKPTQAAEIPAVLRLSPSSLCDVKVWKRLQFPAEAGLPPFACFRPPVAPPHSLPAVLLTPIFGDFLRTAAADVRSLGDCAAESAAVLRLVTLMPRCFESELSRGRAFREVMSDLDIRFEPRHPDPESSACTDGSCVHAVADAHALLGVEEDKLEPATGDPYFQGQAYYLRHWHAAERDGHASKFACYLRPALLLEVMGPMLRVSALATAPGGRVVCEPLTPMLHMFAVTGQPEYLDRLVATLRALRNAMRALRLHYISAAAVAASASAPQPAPALLLPFPLRDGARFAHVMPLLPGKLLYEATLIGEPLERRVCVKLTPRYAPNVHALWAAAGLAPALHTCEPIHGGGPWRLVVMELLAPPTWRPLPDLPLAERPAAAAAAVQALRAAHTVGSTRCVHGDARGVNVLVARGSDDGWHVRFVDFDWSGEEGVAVYPTLMSTAIQWAPGARPGLPLLQEHDTYLLAREE
jgi:hypothetical protein